VAAVGHAEGHATKRRDGHAQRQAVALRGVAAERRADEDVEAPEQSRGEGEREADEVEVAAAFHQQGDAGGREHGPTTSSQRLDPAAPTASGPRNSVVTAIPSGSRASAS